MSEEVMLKVSDVARQLNLSQSKVYELKDEIGYYQIGRSIRFAPAQVERFLEKTKKQREREATERSTQQLSRPRLRHVRL